ncbi:hypothetical protein FHETE_3660 [Fusarium heterosporum]|uniref:NACHT domain-containing protein n=1 Tax=Fusarium heterosporum TaxID=42747 RepID=A0A8H5WUE8_FUSHE|nr:hypothetical protein FHETE_3660 [Fusarium heterosporum]
MEAAGLSIGAMALISLFKDCIDLFSMITAAHGLGKDAAILETKLDVERMLLLRWSDRVRLLDFIKHDTSSNGSEPTKQIPGCESTSPSGPLQDPETRKIVLRVLTSIQSLLSEGTALQKSYGLQRFNSSMSADSQNSGIGAYQGVSASRLEQFLQDFSLLEINTQYKSATHSSRFINITKKFRWVIVHKDRFNTLIADLSYFNSSLMELVPVGSPSTLPSLQEDFSHIRTISELDMVIQVSATIRPAIRAAAIAVKNAILQPQILQRLWFRYHDDRLLNVKEAHYQTLRWALDPPDDYVEWDDLTRWLQDTRSIYWVCGKAGSGKSTLMKYLLSQSRMHELLNKWALDSSFVFVRFFFYALGQPEQKSQSGLLRSLLYQLLSQEPGSIEIILPNMWLEACTNTDRDHSKLSVPSLTEMEAALFHFCKPGNARKKLFLMIDGLDEYEGEDLDAARFITRLGAFPDVKILVSSRPLPAYVTAFSKSPRLNLQDLTRNDITSYVMDSITTHPYLITLSDIQLNVIDDLVQELVGKSSGVFLWVVLACRSVVEGCDDYCSFEELQARIDELPREVEHLLQHMLDKIKPEWRQEAIKLLNIVYTNDSNDSFEPIPTLGLYFAYKQGLQVAAGPTRLINKIKISGQQITTRCRIMEGILRSRCCGLLEIQCAEESFASLHFCVCNPEDGFHPHDSILDSKVVFMHRTVYELLSQPKAWRQDYLVFQSMKLDSHAVLSMMWGQLAHIAYGPRTAVIGALTHIHFGYHNGMSARDTLRCLSKLETLSHYFSAADNLFCQSCSGSSSMVLSLAIEMGLFRAVELAVEDVSTAGYSLLEAACPLQDACRIRDTMLYYATHKPSLRHLIGTSKADTFLPTNHKFSQDLDTIFYILQLGYSPNVNLQDMWKQTSEGVTIWTQWIGEGPCVLSSFGNFVMGGSPKATKLLLDAGAEIQNLQPETLSLLLDKVKKYRRLSKEQNSIDHRDWEDIYKTVMSRLRSTADVDDFSCTGKSRVTNLRQHVRSGSEKRVATNVLTQPAKRQKVIIDLTQD